MPLTGVLRLRQSRTLAWPRRPQAAALMSALADPDRGWDAVVIGDMSGRSTAASTCRWRCCSSTTASSCGCPRWADASTGMPRTTFRPCWLWACYLACARLGGRCGAPAPAPLLKAATAAVSTAAPGPAGLRRRGHAASARRSSADSSTGARHFSGPGPWSGPGCAGLGRPGVSPDR